MKLTVLGASGSTGQELTRQALERGHTVIAISRNPQKIEVPDAERLIRIAADVRDSKEITKALADSENVISCLGMSKDEKPGIITAGAKATVEARPARIVWMGAFGTSKASGSTGILSRILLQIFMRGVLEDKVTADTFVLNAGGTVFHPGPLTDMPLSPNRRTVALNEVPRRIFPASVSRATVAAAMLDEVEKQLNPGRTVVPLDS